MYFSFKRNKTTREGEDNILIQKTKNKSPRAILKIKLLLSDQLFGKLDE